MSINDDCIEMTLNSPITEEQWDAITDVDFEHTNKIWFHTKHGKDVEFAKVVRCKDCMWWDWGWCNNWERGTDENGFCHDAKRKVTE